MFRELRRKKQALPEEACIELLKNERRGALAVHGEEDYPYVVPVNFYYDEEDGKLYFHGAKAGHRLDAIRENNKISFTTWDKGYIEEGDWAYYVKSVVIRGRAELVEDEKIQRAQLYKLGMKYYPTEEMVLDTIRSSGNRAVMLAVTIDHMSGKLVHEE